MKGRTILIINYFILILGIITFGIMLGSITTFTGTLLGVLISIPILILPLTSFFFALHNLKMYGWKMSTFGLFDRIINYTPIFQIISLLLILILIIVKS